MSPCISQNLEGDGLCCRTLLTRHFGIYRVCAQKHENHFRRRSPTPERQLPRSQWDGLCRERALLCVLAGCPPWSLHPTQSVPHQWYSPSWRRTHPPVARFDGSAWLSREGLSTPLYKTQLMPQKQQQGRGGWSWARPSNHCSRLPLVLRSFSALTSP